MPRSAQQLEELKRKLKECTRGVWKDIDQPSDETGCLYHYTDGKGLLGILANKTLWASDPLSLNDASEFEYALEVVRKVLNKTGDRLGLGNVFGNLAGWRQLGQRFFVACFSRDGDKLSQWRAYADKGRGYAIGFGPQELLAEAASHDYALIGLVYDRARQEEQIEKVLDYAAQLVQGQSLTQAFQIEVGMRLLYSMVHLKHPAFEEENERRTLTMEPPRHKIRQRVGGSRIIPYIEVPFVSVAVKCVVIGPCITAKDAENWVRNYLDQSGFSHVVIDRSKIPLRG